MFLVFYTDINNIDHHYSIEEKNISEALTEIEKEVSSLDEVMLCNYGNVLTLAEVSNM